MKPASMYSPHKIFLCGSAGLLLLASLPAAADVYKYVDDSGHVYYTDKPKHSGYKVVVKTPMSIALPFSRSNGGNVVIGRSVQSAQASALGRAQFSQAIDFMASKYRLDPFLLHAVIQAESAYNPSAQSNKGAMGLMQLMPDTANRYGVRNPWNPVENIEGGAMYLRDLLGMFESNVVLALAAYNSGENNVRKYGNKIPPFPETQDYVMKVLSNYRR
ncbi:lytic transglycosylase domain-containing protein [Candidatus Methylospira mobilis]